jgi:hypothetical protein
MISSSSKVMIVAARRIMLRIYRPARGTWMIHHRHSRLISEL